MASMVVRAAAAASLPSSRARRLGSGRLPMAPALPGHGALVLAGRRVRAGHGGLLSAQFMGSTGDAIKAAGAKVASGTAPDSFGDADEFKKAVQEKLKDIAEQCVALTGDAMRRLPRVERRRFENIFWQTHRAFAIVKSRATEGRATLEMALVIAQNLDAVRRMVSRACGVPLPVDMEIKEEDSTLMFPFFSVMEFPVDGVEEASAQMKQIMVVFAMINNLYSIDRQERHRRHDFCRCCSVDLSMSSGLCLSLGSVLISLSISVSTENFGVVRVASCYLS